MIKTDLHLHTQASHATASVQEMFKACQALNLQVIGFSEHSPRPLGYDYPYEYREHLAQCFPQYIKDVQDLKQSDCIETVLLGLELDWLPAEYDFMNKTIAAHNYDYIIGGIHFLDHWGFDSTPSDWQISLDEIYLHYTNYWKSFTNLASSSLVNIIAHPDIIKMFTISMWQNWIVDPINLNLVRTALIATRDCQVAIEVSSAGLRKLCQTIYPGPAVMRICAELGIKISFGSDAHCTNTPAFAFSQLADYANSFGYTESIYFIEGQPQMISF